MKHFVINQILQKKTQVLTRETNGRGKASAGTQAERTSNPQDAGQQQPELSATCPVL